MRNRIITLACCVVLCVVFLIGCNSNQVKQVEVTRIVRETVVVTEAAPPVTQTPEPVDESIFSVENNEIRILVTEYYVLLDYGLYEEAFNLLDPSFQEKYSLEQFTEGQSAFYDEIELVRVEAYDEFTERGDLEKLIPPKDIGYVFVDLITWPKGSKPNDGMPEQMFVQLKQSDNGWRISNFWTSPPTR